MKEKLAQKRPSATRVDREAYLNILSTTQLTGAVKEERT